MEYFQNEDHTMHILEYRFRGLFPGRLRRKFIQYLDNLYVNVYIYNKSTFDVVACKKDRQQKWIIIIDIH